MRDQVFFIDKSLTNEIYNRGWYVFYYISVTDILAFILTVKDSVYVSIDIDDEKVLKRGNFKLKRRVKRKYRKYANNLYFTVNKYSAVNALNSKFRVGTTVIFSENNTLEVVSETELLKKIKDNNFNNGLYFDFFFSVHDYDWETLVYFKEETMLNAFINFIEENAVLNITDNQEQFS